MKARNIKIEKELVAYIRNIDEYRKSLQRQSIWLFVAILGCWSVSGSIGIKIFAYVITGLYFYSLVFSEITVKKKFNDFEKNIEKMIAGAYIEGPSKTKYEEILGLVKVKRKSWCQIVKSAPMFILCLVFLAWSIYEQFTLVADG
uniref:hypothetical protein n=1 Tax=Microbulbifer agarilyticus TaxID=260552 RepID=UPI000255B760|nr:hypothetical protein [Microbulbifer agarilyticus]